MAIEHRMVHFRDSDRGEVITELERITEGTETPEWITISPWVDDEELPVSSVLRRMFSARGSKIPEVTWVPAQEGEPAQLGIIHSTGPGAFERLAELGVDVPATWHKIGDHSRRGLVFAVDPATPASRVVGFAVDAARVLAEVATDDRWVAQVSIAGS
ncbi:MAG: hypothetical protein AAF567_05940 [Actinomycetota bacterium]